MVQDIPSPALQQDSNQEQSAVRQEGEEERDELREDRLDEFLDIMKKINDKHNNKIKELPKRKFNKPVLSREEKKTLLGELGEQEQQVCRAKRLETLGKNLYIIRSLEQALLRCYTFLLDPIRLLLEEL